MVPKILAPLALDRTELLADLAIRVKAWRNMQAVAEDKGELHDADLHKARAEAFEQLAHDLREQPITEVRR